MTRLTNRAVIEQQLTIIIQAMHPKLMGGGNTWVVVRLLTGVENNEYFYTIRVRTLHDPVRINKYWDWAPNFVAEVNKLALSFFLSRGIDMRVDIEFEQETEVAAIGVEEYVRRENARSTSRLT